MMDKYLDNLCDELDASVFSGDRLLDKENLDNFQVYLGRWNRKAKEYQEIIGNIYENGELIK